MDEVTRETFKGIRRAFAMMALAMLAAKPRNWLAEGRYPIGVSTKRVIDAVTIERLQLCVVNGDVTCIVPDPQPFTFLHYQGTFGEVKLMYGLWIGRAASWRGQRTPPKRVLQPADETAMPTGEDDHA